MSQRSVKIKSFFFLDVDAEAEEVLNELNRLTESEDNNTMMSVGGGGKLKKSEDMDWGQTIGKHFLWLLYGTV